MDINTPAVSNAPVTAAAKGWSEAQEQVITMFVDKLGMVRSNAIRKLRSMELHGLTPEEILAKPVAPRVAQVQEAKAPKAKKTPKAPKAKKEPKAKSPMMSKPDRLAYAAKHNKTELEVYMGECEKHGIEPAKSAAKRWKALKAAK